MNYEEVKDQSVTDLDAQDFREMVVERFKELRPEVFEKLDDESIYDEAVKLTLEHRVFGRQKVASATSRTIRNILKLFGDNERQRKLDELETIDGYWIGGEDWKPSAKSGKTEADKQSVTLLTTRGLETMGVFGHSPSKDIDLVEFQKYRFTYSVYEATNGKVYNTIKRIELLDSSIEEFADWISNEEIIEPIDLIKDDLWKPIVLEATLTWIQGKPILTNTGEKTQVVKDGEVQYDEKGNALMKDKWVVSENEVEPVIQASLDARQEDMHVAYWKLASDTGDEGTRKYVEVRFYNKRLGRHTIDVALFRNDDLYGDLCSLDPEEGIGFMLDELRREAKPLLFVAIPKKFKSYKNREDVEVETVELSGLFVSDRIIDMIREVKSKKKE